MRENGGRTEKNLYNMIILQPSKRYSYIGTPLKYYFMDMGLRNSRIHYRQMEVTHSMKNIIYNEKYYIQSAYMLETEAKMPLNRLLR